MHDIDIPIPCFSAQVVSISGTASRWLSEPPPRSCSKKNGPIGQPARLMATHAVTLSEWSALVSTLSGMLEPPVNLVARAHVPAEPEVRFVSEPETVEDSRVLCEPLRHLHTPAPVLWCPAPDELVSCMDGGAGLCAGSCSVRSFSVRDFEPRALQTSPGYPGRSALPVGGFHSEGLSIPVGGSQGLIWADRARSAAALFPAKTACHLGIR